MRVRPLIQPAGRPVPGVVHRPRHRMPILQPGFQQFHPASIGVRLGSHTGYFFKGPLQMKRADPQLPAQRRQSHRLLRVALKIPAGFFHQLRPGIRPAAFADSEPGPLRALPVVEKSHILALRQTRMTGRTAIHARSHHAVIKLPIQPGISIRHRFPLFVHNLRLRLPAAS